MYFLVLLIMLIPLGWEKEYKIITYIKIFISSLICFYYMNSMNDTYITLLLSLLSFMVIIYLVYKLVKEELTSKSDTSMYNLAHEVKNPLAVCKGYLDMIDINDKEKLEKYLPIIKKEMNRSLSIMNDFLCIKKITLNKELMDFSLLLDDVVETLNLSYKESNVRINSPKVDNELIIDGDYDKLKQVLVNIIKNSYEADAKNIDINIKKNSSYLKVIIKDDGKGITKNDLKKIGELFYTTKLAGTGIGVGLSKRILELHDGNLSYDSLVNKGTTATIILPLKYVF